MEDDEFCQMLLYSLINLVCFLLTVIFLTTLKNVESQTKLLEIDKLKQFESYGNSYTATAVIFTFNFFGFIGFMMVLMAIIKKIKVNRINRESNRDIATEQQNNGGTGGTVDIGTESRLNNGHQFGEAVTIDDNSGIQVDTLRKIMFFLFIYCQALVLIEIIILTVYHGKARDLEKSFGIGNDPGKEEGKYFTRIYRDLIIIGYILLFLFILFDLYTIVLLTKFGKRITPERNTSNFENLEQNKYCKVFNDCLINCCEKMYDVFRYCEREGEDTKKMFENDLEQIELKVNELNDYKGKLENFNNKIRQKENITRKEFEELHLPKLDDNDNIINTANVVTYNRP